MSIGHQTVSKLKKTLIPCCHFESTKQPRYGATDGNKGFRKLLNSKQACNYSRMFPTSDTDGFIFITSVKTEG